MHVFQLLFEKQLPLFAIFALTLLLTFATTTTVFALQEVPTPDLGVVVTGPLKDPLTEGESGVFKVRVTNQTKTALNQTVKFSIIVGGHPDPKASITPPSGVKCTLGMPRVWNCEVAKLNANESILVNVTVTPTGRGVVRVDSAILDPIDASDPDQEGAAFRSVDEKTLSTVTFQLPGSPSTTDVRIVGEARIGDEVIKFDRSGLDGNASIELPLINVDSETRDGVRSIDQLRATAFITLSANIAEVTPPSSAIAVSAGLTTTATITTFLIVHGVPSTGEAQISSNSPAKCGMNVYKRSSEGDVALDCSETNGLAWLNQRDVRFAKFVSNIAYGQTVLAANRVDSAEPIQIQIEMTAKPDLYQIYLPSVER